MRNFNARISILKNSIRAVFISINNNDNLCGIIQVIHANTLLEALGKTLKTKDYTHLEKYLSDDFKFEDTNGELDNLENIKSWCIAGGLRINNFKTIRENENYIVATHDVIQEGKPKSNVLVYAEQTNGKFIYWKIQRAFEAQFT